MMRPVRPRRSRIAVAALVAIGLVAAGCGRGEDPLEIGFRRVALDLAFKDPDKAVPAEPNQVVRTFIETEFEIGEPEPVGPRVVRRVRTFPEPEEVSCPTAPEGTTPEEPAFAVVKSRPKTGSYPRHNTGELQVTLGTQTFPIPVPSVSRWAIPVVQTVSAHRLVNDHDPSTPAPPNSSEMVEFELTRRLLFGYSVTDTYRYTADGATGGDFLYLVKRVNIAQGERSEFIPSPPIRIVRLNVPEGNIAEAGVAHGGVDRRTDVAMTVQSQIVAREWVDVCGEVVDTYRVQVREQFVDLSKNPPETYGNEGDRSNFWNIQFDNGLLLVREEVHSTQRTSREIAGQSVPVEVRYDYVSTLNSMTPEPLEPDGSSR